MPHWEDLECEVKLNILSIIVLTVVTNTGGSQVPVLGRGHQLGRGAGGVRAVRRLAGQHRWGEGAQLSAALKSPSKPVQKLWDIRILMK